MIIEQKVLSRIYLIRGRKVMLDRDLAALYGVETRVLNQAVKRNADRFPPDFMFQLDAEELKNWMSQFVISNPGSTAEKMGLRKLPFAFTEQGVAMLSSVLGSKTAIHVNIQIIRIFTKMREMIVSNKDILLKLGQIEKTLMEQGKRIEKGEAEMQMVFDAIRDLLEKPAVPRQKIGFGTNDN